MTKKNKSPNHPSSGNGVTYKLSLTLMQAVSMINEFHAMKGDGAPSAEQRTEVIDVVTRIFPEALDPKTKQPAIGEKRIVELTSRQIRAVSHGIIIRMNAAETDGAAYMRLRMLAKPWGLLTYILSHIKPETAPEFEGDLDDAPDLVDQSEDVSDTQAA